MMNASKNHILIMDNSLHPVGRNQQQTTLLKYLRKIWLGISLELPRKKYEPTYSLENTRDDSNVRGQ